jgi:cell division protein FtsI/penicillin-binding protein 2
MRYRKMVGAAVVLVLGAGSLAACGDDDGAPKALTAFLTAWQENRLGGKKLVDANGAPLSGDTAQADLTKLEGDLATRRPKITVTGRITGKEPNASAPVKIDWPVADAVTWSYPSTVRLVKKKDAWLPVFSPQTVHPDISSFDAKLTRTETYPERGSILDAAGQPIVRNLPVVIVGVEPQRVTDPVVLVGGLKSIFAELGVEVTVDDLPERIKNAGGPNAFIEVATLRRDAYDRVQRPLKDLPGTIFRTGTLPLAPTAVFGRGLLGQVGEVTREILDKNPGKYRNGDRVGLNGLQQRYEDRLRGTPGIVIRADGKVMFEATQAGGPPSVKTTIEVAAQNAADAALAGLTRRAAVVAIRISTGAVAAVANGPGGGRLNLAFTAQVPPGSTFKMVSTYGLLDNGAITLDTPIDCPATTVVEGRTFKNSDGLGALGTVPFRTAFARSCNTAFTALAPKLGADGLGKAGTALGLGTPWDLGADVYTGAVSTGGSATEQAAAAFGQGTTQVSPIAMAAAAAAVARGQWKQPVLITDPAPAKPAPDGPALKPEAVAALQTMMREVVTAGSGIALKGLPGAPVHGKTGTAEFDSADPTKTHAWFIGWKGDVAFAVFVEEGGGGSATAVPIASKFLLTLGV